MYSTILCESRYPIYNRSHLLVLTPSGSWILIVGPILRFIERYCNNSSLFFFFHFHSYFTDFQICLASSSIVPKLQTTRKLHMTRLLNCIEHWPIYLVITRISYNTNFTISFSTAIGLLCVLQCRKPFVLCTWNSEDKMTKIIPREKGQVTKWPSKERLSYHSP